VGHPEMWVAGLLQVLLFLLPWPLRRWALRLCFGFEIAPRASIGLSILLVDNLVLAGEAKIGHLTLVRGLRSLRIDTFGRLGSLNWVTAIPSSNTLHFTAETERNPSLTIGAHAAITNRHRIDCIDAVRIGPYTTLGGWGSQILTHAIDLRTGCQTCAPVDIGSYCFVGTRVVVLKGSTLPDYSVLAAGSVLGRRMVQTGMIYSGVPAVAIRAVDLDGKYFSRESGFVF
jgi:acetyltransferase-like isoleucine patch superfamily enzyme